MTTLSFRNIFLILTLTLVALTNPATLFGRSRYGSGYGRSAPSNGQVVAAQRQVAAAAGQLKQAQSRFRAQTRQLMIVRQEVQKDHSQDATFVDAHRKWDDSKKELSSVKVSILGNLKSYTPEYKASLKERDTLKRQIQDDDFDSNSERDAALKKYAAAVSRIAHLEKEAIYADTNGAILQKQVDNHDSDFLEQVKKREVAIDNDSRLINAKDAIRSAKADVDKADTQLAVAQQQLASAQLNYQRQLLAYSNRGRNYRRY